jgi:integrase/recombinase XerC
MVQIWFRGPKIWEEFLDEKAARELCSKSDLLRRAFKLTYETELKEYRTPTLKEAYYTDSPKKNEEATDVLRYSSSVPTLYNLDNDPWMESIAAFVANKRSPQTRRVYKLVLNQFFSFILKHPRKVKQSDLIRYRYYLEQMGRAPVTIRLHLSAISGYYTFCISRNLTIHNPVKGVNQPVVKSYTRATWLNKEQAKILLSQPNRNTLKGKRDYAIILTFLLTGLRRKELANIRKKDIQTKGNKIYLTYDCKGGAKIVRDIPQICWKAIQEYLKFSEREMRDDSPIFISVNNRVNSKVLNPITPEAIRQTIAYYSHRAFGDTIRVSPHTLRHTAGTLLRKSGRTIEEVQSFLKHKRIDTTRIYLHVVESDDSEFGECIAKVLEI